MFITLQVVNFYFNLIQHLTDFLILVHLLVFNHFFAENLDFVFKHFKIFHDYTISSDVHTHHLGLDHDEDKNDSNEHLIPAIVILNNELENVNFLTLLSLFVVDPNFLMHDCI